MINWTKRILTILCRKLCIIIITSMVRVVSLWGSHCSQNQRVCTQSSRFDWNDLCTISLSSVTRYNSTSFPTPNFININIDKILHFVRLAYISNILSESHSNHTVDQPHWTGTSMSRYRHFCLDSLFNITKDQVLKVLFKHDLEWRKMLRFEITDLS